MLPIGYRFIKEAITYIIKLAMTGLQYFLPTGMLNTNKYIYQNNLNFVSCTPGICEWLFSC